MIDESRYTVSAVINTAGVTVTAKDSITGLILKEQSCDPKREWDLRIKLHQDIVKVTSVSNYELDPTTYPRT